MTIKTAGFTLIEVMVSVVILTIGLLALAGATANVTKMAGSGKWSTRASQMAGRRLEAIRQIAKSTTPQCTSAALVSGGPVAAGAMSESWFITGTGTVRRIQVVVTYPRANRSVTDTVATLLRCN